MKTLGIQIYSSEARLVVLQGDSDNIELSPESTKFSIDDHSDSEQIKQFREQVNASFDLIKPDRIGIKSRNPKAKGRQAPSPISFKLEGIIQLYDKREVEFIAPQTIAAFLKKNPLPIDPMFNYQADALSVAYYLIS